jgi:hypothetical protein
VIGMSIYFLYGRRNSTIGRQESAAFAAGD